MTPLVPGSREPTEATFTRNVMQCGGLYGWLCYHTHDSRRSNPGFPDVVFVRERVVYAELKAKTGRLRPEQIVWMQKLKDAGQEVYLWRPDDWPTILEILRKPPKERPTCP